jgi:hypothetical protein
MFHAHCTQALTTSVAVWYGLEAFNLRSKENVLDEPPPPGVCVWVWVWAGRLLDLEDKVDRSSKNRNYHNKSRAV